MRCECPPERGGDLRAASPLSPTVHVPDDTPRALSTCSSPRAGLRIGGHEPSMAHGGSGARVSELMRANEFRPVSGRRHTARNLYNEL